MLDVEVTSLSGYVSAFSGVITKGDLFWFRGHEDYTYRLIPSALRFKERKRREQAIKLLAEFKRCAEFKLEKPPDASAELKWLQLGQHYGLPTRLLDWTQNSAVALYFACQDSACHGAVLLMKPIDLNFQIDPKNARVFDPNSDQEMIEPFLRLDGRRNSRGKRTIAIQPTWNSQRIMLQQGAFTLHGSRDFELTGAQAPSLCFLPIVKQYKQGLLEELELIGVSEMSIFPEPDHVCRYLKSHHGLTGP